MLSYLLLGEYGGYKFQKDFLIIHHQSKVMEFQDKLIEEVSIYLDKQDMRKVLEIINCHLTKLVTSVDEVD